MEVYSIKERVQIIKFYYENQCSVRQTLRALRNFFPRHRRPAESTIRRLVAKFESTGSINNQPTPVRHRNARTTENIAAVQNCIKKNPYISISQLSKELELNPSTVNRIMRLDLNISANGNRKRVIKDKPQKEGDEQEESTPGKSVDE